MGAFVNLECAAGVNARLYVSGFGAERSPEAGASTGVEGSEVARPGVLVLHPWWGLNQDLQDYCDRLAAEGFAVVAPDMFGGKVETTIEGAERLADGADQAIVGSIVLAVVDWLAERTSVMAVLGFSYGAAWAIWAPTRRPDLAATAVYYGIWTGPVVDEADVPVLGHFAEHDPFETAESVAEFEQALAKAGRAAEIHRYPGTGHWFAEPSRTDAYDPTAAGLAFDRTVRFLRECLQR